MPARAHCGEAPPIGVRFCPARKAPMDQAPEPAEEHGVGCEDPALGDGWTERLQTAALWDETREAQASEFTVKRR